MRAALPWTHRYADSVQRHVTRQMILNWRKVLRFPSNLVVTSDGINFLEQLICEREDRLGSQVSYSGHYGPHGAYSASRSGGIPIFFGTSVGGAEYIKVSTLLIPPMCNIHKTF